MVVFLCATAFYKPTPKQLAEMADMIRISAPSITKPMQFVQRWANNTAAGYFRGRPGRGRHGWADLIKPEELDRVARSVEKGMAFGRKKRPFTSMLKTCPEAEAIVNKYNCDYRALRTVLLRRYPQLTIVKLHPREGLSPVQHSERARVAQQMLTDKKLANPNRIFMVDESSFDISKECKRSKWGIIVRGSCVASEQVSDDRIHSKPKKGEKSYKYLGVVNPLVGTTRVAWCAGTPGMQRTFKASHIDDIM